MAPFLLHRTLLKPSYTLRKQLSVSFGVCAVLTLTFVVALACLSARSGGDYIQDDTRDVLNTQVRVNVLQYNLYLANHLTEYFSYLEGAAQLVVEITQDRLMGYPQGGWQEDRFVPFYDTESQGYKYPLNNQGALRHDWDILRNVNASNARENLIDRAEPCAVTWPIISTATPSFHMPGSCNPTASPGSRAYLPNCTEANNNIETGGIVSPSTTTKPIFDKAADIGLLLKPIYEAVGEIYLLGVYFANAGAGLSMYFPGFIQSSQGAPYESIGCDWMKEINPRTGRPFATQDEIDKCNPAGTLVNQRNYNPLEQTFFRDFAVHGDRMHLFGPSTSPNQGGPLLSVGRAIFDRLYVLHARPNLCF